MRKAEITVVRSQGVQDNEASLLTRARFSRTFAIAAEGFSEGQFCPLPEQAPKSRPGIKTFSLLSCASCI